MKKRSIFLMVAMTFIGSAFAQETAGFTFGMKYDCGFGNARGSSNYNLTIGMNEDATDALDPKIDSPAPPIPPEVCYAHFIGPEGKPPFNVLWTDIRGISDKGKWVINNIRNTGGGALTFSIEELPSDYSLWVGGANLRFINDGKILTDENDAFIDVLVKYGVDNNTCAIAAEEIISSVILVDEGSKEHEIKIKNHSDFVTFTPKVKSGKYIFKLKNEEREIGTGTILVP